MNMNIRFDRGRNAAHRNKIVAVFVAVIIMVTASVWAGQIRSVSWGDKAKEPQLSIKFNKRPSSFEVRSFDGGRRLRLILHDTTLRASIRDLGSQGIVKSVFSYVAGNGTSTHIDFLMHEPGKLDVSTGRRGYRVRVNRYRGAKNGAKAGKTAITGIIHTKLPGGRVQLTIKMSGIPPKPDVFTVSKPARISLDFHGVISKLPKKTVGIKAGAVDNVSVITSGGRTRVLLSLYSLVRYTARVAENSYVLTLQSPGATARDRGEARTTHFAGSKGRGRYAVTDVDFRRDKQSGGAKIVIHLSNPSVGVDIREKGGEIIIDFIDAATPKSLQRRLNVTDFGTPVQTIDTFMQGRNTRVVITPTGAYEHLAYQAGNVFTIDVKPLSKAAIEAKKRAAEKKRTYTGDKLSLNFQRIDVRDALQVLADFTGKNFVISDSVQGNLTLRLNDVPWDQALDIILEAKQLAKREKGNVSTLR